MWPWKKYAFRHIAWSIHLSFPFEQMCAVCSLCIVCILKIFFFEFIDIIDCITWLMYRACKASNEICAAMLLHSHPWCLCSKVIQLIFLWRAKHTTNYIFKHFHFKNSNNIIAFARTNQWTNARHFPLSLHLPLPRMFPKIMRYGAHVNEHERERERTRFRHCRSQFVYKAFQYLAINLSIFNHKRDIRLLYRTARAFIIRNARIETMFYILFLLLSDE